MKIKIKIAALLTGFGLVTACSDDISSAYTVGEADNAIVLGAGIGEGGAGVTTRANVSSESHHGSHKTFTAGTKLTLRVDGTWTGHSPATVSQTTTGYIDGIAANTNDKHNVVKFATGQQLYWDDYGTADPNNMPISKGGNVSNGTDGRSKGLTIYGAAVNDATASAPEINGSDGKKWTALTWSLGTKNSDGVVDQSTNGWTAQDLLISNNVQTVTTEVNYAVDGTFKFDSDPRTKLLEFTHAMSKITVRLIANEGFPTNGTVGATPNKFASAPEVILTSNEGTATTNAEWPYTSSTVNVEAKAVTSPATPAKVKMHQGTVPSDQTTTCTAIYDALVAPGSVFTDKGAGATDPYPIIARIKADDNIYYVTSEKIRAAITTKYGSGNENGFATQPGVNYIIDVKINKTKIEVTATITDWDPITAAEVTPVINVGASYGSNTNNFGKDAFSFYRSTAMNNGYSSSVSAVNGFTPAEATVSKSSTTWTMSPALYWPTHDTHYQMRGVWPQTGTETGEVNYPRVETATHSGVDYQVIKVKNVAYEANTFPSDLAIGRPDVATTATCSNSDHTAKNLYSDGICATEGKVNLAFEYMMSKVEVNLSTTDGNNQVNLTGAVVEVTNLYTTGDIKLGDRGAIPTGDALTYGLHATSTANQFMDAIVPQALTFSTAGASTNVRFKITITNNDAVMYANADEYNTDKGYSPGNPGYCTDFSNLTTEQKTKTPATKDIYYADVNPIKKTGSNDKVAPNGKWESGKYYVYNLKLSKTKIDVTATFKDWVTVTASEDVWF